MVSLLVLAAPAREEVLGKLKQVEPGSGRRQRDYSSREMRFGSRRLEKDHGAGGIL